MLKVKNNQNDNIVISGGYFFWSFKRIFDLVICSFLLPFLILMMIIVPFFNGFFNKGTVFFIQKRMGKDCMPFYAIKFRTMEKVNCIDRKHFDPLEIDRITPFGRILRNIKLDELPQILNVIKGEMSLIGPRPDYYEHALLFLESVPHYKYRHVIRPGISGLSQIRLGYAEGIDATKKKSKIDVFYIENVDFFLDVKIFFGTLNTVLKGFSI